MKKPADGLVINVIGDGRMKLLVKIMDAHSRVDQYGAIQRRFDIPMIFIVLIANLTDDFF